jgi:hypothetical protein
MLKSAKFRAALCVVILLAFLAGLARVLVLRYRRGDIHPAYSSYRTDPKGVAILYEALRTNRKLEVSRGLEPIQDFHHTDAHTIFLLGIPQATAVSPEFLELVEDLAREGHRVVAAMAPVVRSHYERKPDKKDKKDEKNEEEKDEETEDRFILEMLPGDGPAWAIGPEMEWEEELPWFSRVWFKETPWEAAFWVEDKVVGVKQRFGKGEVVLLGDSYLFSNEAMLSARRPAFLRWCVGSSRKVLFDEYHLGLAKQVNTMGLIRRYGILPVLVAALVAGVLFLWQSALPFPPRREPGEDFEDPVSGIHAKEGLIKLLQRSIPQREILRACVDEWKLDVSAAAEGPGRSYKAALAVLEEECARPAEKRDPVSAYNKAAEILEKKRI